MSGKWDAVDWETRCAVARVRVLAAREMLAAGGAVTNADLVRAIEPVIGDIIPWAPREYDGDLAAQIEWQQREDARKYARAMRVARRSRRKPRRI